MGLTVSQSPSSACAHMPRLFLGPDCFTVSTCCTYIDLGSRGYFGVNVALVLFSNVIHHKCNIFYVKLVQYNECLISIADTDGLCFSTRAPVAIARARPAVPLGLWSITSSLCGNFYVPGLHKFIKWFADNDFPHHNLTCTELFVIS